MQTLTCVAAGAAAVTCWRGARFVRDVRTGRALARATARFQRRVAAPAARVMVVGDSTALGTGAGRAECSVGGLIARAYPDVDVVTRARAGARLRDIPALLGTPRYVSDVVLLLAGGNDVLSYTDEEQLQADAERAVAHVGSHARLTVVAGAANIGNAPMFFWPVRHWLTRRAAKVRHAVAAACSQHGACHVDFFRATGDRFSTEPSRYFAVDGLHPSAASYRVCFDTIRRSTPFDAVVSGSSAAKAGKYCVHE